MSAINTKIKTIILTAISAAILSACGGGGGSGGASTLSTGSTSTGGNGSPAKNSSPSNATPSATNDNNAVAIPAPHNNRADNLAGLIDESPLEALNLATPLHTSFISSTSAQQGNPNVQVRRSNENDKLFQTDNQINNQNGLVSSLDFKANDEVKLDEIILYNKTEEGNATQV